MARGLHAMPVVLHFHTEQFQFQLQTTAEFKGCSEELLALARSIGMQAVSAMNPTAQPQPFTGHAKEDLQFLGTFGIS